MHHHYSVRESDFEYIFAISYEFYNYINMFFTVLISIHLFPLQEFHLAFLVRQI